MTLALIVCAGSGLAQSQAGDPAAGKEAFEQQCARCHAIGQGAVASNAGPPLNGVMGRRSGTYPDFNYSPQFRSARLTWQEPVLARFLEAPRRAVPGTKMLFNGLSSPQAIADVMAYLAQFDETGSVKK